MIEQVLFSLITVGKVFLLINPAKKNYSTIYMESYGIKIIDTFQIFFSGF